MALFILFSSFALSLGSSKSILIKDVSNTPTSATRDNYEDSNYVNLRKISSNSLKYEANGGDHTKWVLSNAFDGRTDTYWMSNTTNSDTFMNTLTISFDKFVTLEAFLYDTAYQTKGPENTRTYWGYPTKLNVYASTTNNQYQHVATFTGSHSYPTTRVQFVFPNPVSCTKLRLDFAEVTNQSMSGSGQNPIIGDLLFLRYAPVIQTGSPTGKYTNLTYVAEKKVPKEDFTATANGGESSRYPLSNAFDDNKNTYWVSNTANANSFINTITVNFKETISLEAFLIDTAYSTNKTAGTRVFWGYPEQCLCF